VLKNTARLTPLAIALALAAAPSAHAAEVTVGDKSFAPADVSINVGDAVTWRWTSGPHNVHVTAGPEKFDSGFKDSGATYIHTFTTAGTYSYICDAHPSMRGAVTARRAPRCWVRMLRISDRSREGIAPRESAWLPVY